MMSRVNTREPSPLRVVNFYKPKRLIGLSQTAQRRAWRLSAPPAWAHTSPAHRGHLTPSGHLSGTW